MPRKQYYSIYNPPSLSMTELEKTTLDHDATDMLIDKWLEHRCLPHDAYLEWFRDIRERKHINSRKRQALLWNKGEFVPENIFCRTVDTGRLIPLDRTWTTHVYHHRSLQDRNLSMMHVVFTMLPELMILRGMHDLGCDEIFIIVTDLKRQEMDEVTEYFKLVCRNTFGRTCKDRIRQQIQLENMRISHTLGPHRRTPCFPQIDLTLRAILFEKRPRFIVLFSNQTTPYSQILFTHNCFVPDEEIFYDYPTGCPNPCCTEDCEMIRFPRRGLDTASVLKIKRGGRFRSRQMCNWIECQVCFDEETVASSSSESSETSTIEPSRTTAQVCSKCKLVQYCCLDHQKKDWDEHRRVCVKAPAGF
ncbi:hypothetical protein CYLTODRAFT_418367 [Cylindrobasidium torrendii FP15055 ss-10]|uniref:MYND-type domain-containing protein n=1 Tax=Cylindrobasidium torrendii FP15055 ss-10 TaxID=1314674 RepID=A0A0D7BP62_9AGAR|nr:hypothetical protein CYLTODRAFT_418367 [Cylindrobasidium torrendii FP15055 ss-10]